ncbi:hypothetical protein BHE74_00004065, partial [Ensete ventricosum]
HTKGPLLDCIITKHGLGKSSRETLSYRKPRLVTRPELEANWHPIGRAPIE